MIGKTPDDLRLRRREPDVRGAAALPRPQVLRAWTELTVLKISVGASRSSHVWFWREVASATTEAEASIPQLG
jgi:hypothetical protein